MKKSILLGTLFCAAILFSTNIDMRLGRDLTSNVTGVKGSGKASLLEFSYEMTSLDDTKFSYGFGMATNGTKIKIDKYRDTYEKFSSYPLYLIGTYNFKPENIEGLRPYIKAKLGFSPNNKTKSYKEGDISTNMKLKNGAYTGIGIGVRTKNYTTYELSYNVNFFSAKINKVRETKDYWSSKTITEVLSDEKFSGRKGALTFSIGITLDVN